MNDDRGAPGDAAGRPADGRDLRVVFIERRQAWWWNAWQAATGAELYGFAETLTAAWSAMNTAVSAAHPPVSRPRDGAADRRRRHRRLGPRSR
jgi:hypothetical protein